MNESWVKNTGTKLKLREIKEFSIIYLVPAARHHLRSRLAKELFTTLAPGTLDQARIQAF